ncbi:hypothetical protein ACWTQY_29880, partial [Klebsiella pneumoniae]
MASANAQLWICRLGEPILATTETGKGLCNEEAGHHLLLGAAFWQFYLSKPGSPIISNIASDGSVMDNPVVTQPGSSSFSLD